MKIIWFSLHFRITFASTAAHLISTRSLSKDHHFSSCIYSEVDTSFAALTRKTTNKINLLPLRWIEVNRKSKLITILTGVEYHQNETFNRLNWDLKLRSLNFRWHLISSQDNYGTMSSKSLNKLLTKVRLNLSIQRMREGERLVRSAHSSGRHSVWKLGFFGRTGDVVPCKHIEAV